MLNLFPQDAASLADAVWIDLFNPSGEEISRVEKSLSLTIPRREALEEIESSSRLQFEDGVLQLSTPVSAHGDDEGPTPVGFVLTNKCLITIRYTQMHAFDSTAQFCNKKAHGLSSSEVFVSLIEGMVDYGADMLEKIGGHLNDMSRQVFRRYARSNARGIKHTTRALKEILTTIGDTGDRLSQIRESLLGIQRVAPFARENAGPWMSPDLRARLEIVVRDINSLADFEVHLSNKVQFLLDAVLGFINTEQNDIFKVLTIASVIGIPPTFFASMWGMNFKTMHEYDWHYGYAMALGVMVVSIILPIIWFKIRGWW